MNTLLAILKVEDARRDVILAGGLYHRFPWRHLPPPPLVYLYISLHLAYIIYLNTQLHKENVDYAYFTRQELEHRILYRRNTEQFKLHFTDIQKSKIQY